MQKILSVLIISTYSFLLLFGAFSFHYENHNLGIMGPECHHTVCLNIFKDIDTWHDLLLTFMPLVKILLSIPLFFILFKFYRLYLYKKINYKICNYLIFDHLSLLYSKGILNPKSP